MPGTESRLRLGAASTPVAISWSAEVTRVLISAESRAFVGVVEPDVHDTIDDQIAITERLHRQPAS